MQASTREQRGPVRGPALLWSTALLVLQLLLILAPFVLILFAPALLPTLPNLGSHPTTSSKVRDRLVNRFICPRPVHPHIVI